MAVGTYDFALGKLISYYLQGAVVMYEPGHAVQLLASYMIWLQHNRIRLTAVYAWMGLIVVPNELKITPTNLVKIQQLGLGRLRRMLLAAFATLGIVPASVSLSLLKVLLKILY
jgi:hypothetical protein